MVTALVIIVVLLVAAGAAAAVTRSRASTPKRALPPQRTPVEEERALSGDVRRLRPRDVVAYEGTDFMIDRTIHFDEDGFTWQEHLLLDAVSGRKLWLSVEDDEGVEVAIYEPVAGVDLEPGPASVEHDGVTFKREERGRARFRIERSDQQAPEQGQMEYADYSAGDRLLSFERYGSGGWEVSTGSVISEHVLDLYPAQ
jgi:hypothetical protein